MIIGHGDIAKALQETELPNYLFFASGVSNSQETRESEYEREVELMLQQDRTNHIVYFSTLSVFYTNTRYTMHKREMERFIKLGFENYTIVRIGNITWGDNPNTLINYIKNRAKEGKNIKLKDEYRYIVDKKEFLHWMKLIPAWSCEMNIPGKMMKVKEVVETYCK